MYVLNMHFNTGAIWCLGGPEVEVFVSSGFKIEGVVAVVEICELGEEMEVVLGIELGVWMTL
jgi:hypothetical protein